MHYDAVIVGASLAGCRCALTLAAPGRRLLLLDRQRFPRWKPCAGGVTVKAEPYVDPALRDRFERTLHGVTIFRAGERVARLRTTEPVGWTIHRERFDAAHVELAASHDAVEFRPGVAFRGLTQTDDGVTVETDDGTLTAEVVVGADGANSRVSRHLPGHDRRHLGFAFEGEATWLRPALDDEVLFEFGSFPHGYGWIFPKQDHYSLGGFVYGRSLPGVRKLYDRFCAVMPQLDGCRTYRTRGHRIPHGGRRRKPNGGRLLLAGDAADLVDPLTGEGIAYALRSGHEAAEAIAAFLADGTSLDAYGDAIRDGIQRDFAHARRFAGLVYRAPLSVIVALFRSERVCRWFVDVLHGRRRYADLWGLLMRKNVRLPFLLRQPAKPAVGSRKRPDHPAS